MLWLVFLSTLLCDFFAAIVWVVIFQNFSLQIMRRVAANPPRVGNGPVYDNMGYVGLFLGGLLMIGLASLVGMGIYVWARVRKERRSDESPRMGWDHARRERHAVTD
ncbi:MAG: hypothetical protein LKI24_04505 [Acidipropionibacterium sp.]|jgi:hypothetical protein|nr:hypothetical protein [Acidipropionibacterium sp.]